MKNKANHTNPSQELVARMPPTAAGKEHKTRPLPRAVLSGDIRTPASFFARPSLLPSHRMSPFAKTAILCPVKKRPNEAFNMALNRRASCGRPPPPLPGRHPHGRRRRRSRGCHGRPADTDPIYNRHDHPPRGNGRKKENVIGIEWAIPVKLHEP